MKNLETCLEREDIQGAKQSLFEMLQIFRKLDPDVVSNADFIENFQIVDDLLLTIDNEMAVSKDFVIAQNHELALDEAYHNGFEDGFVRAIDIKGGV